MQEVVLAGEGTSEIFSLSDLEWRTGPTIPEDAKYHVQAQLEVQRDKKNNFPLKLLVLFYFFLFLRLLSWWWAAWSTSGAQTWGRRSTSTRSTSTTRVKEAVYVKNSMNIFALFQTNFFPLRFRGLWAPARDPVRPPRRGGGGRRGRPTGAVRLMMVGERKVLLRQN